MDYKSDIQDRPCNVDHNGYVIMRNSDDAAARLRVFIDQQRQLREMDAAEINWRNINVW